MQTFKMVKLVENTTAINYFDYVPTDVIKYLISFHESLQWFLLNKKISAIAKDAIDEKKYKKENGVRLIIDFINDTPPFLKRLNIGPNGILNPLFYDGLITYILFHGGQDIYEMVCVRLKTQVCRWRKLISNANKLRISLFCLKQNVGILLSATESAEVMIIDPLSGNYISSINLSIIDHHQIFLTKMDGYLLYRNSHTMFGINIQNRKHSEIEWLHEACIGAPKGCGNYFMYHSFHSPTVIVSADDCWRINLGVNWEASFRNSSEIYVIKNGKPPNTLDVYSLENMKQNSLPTKSICLNMDLPHIQGIASNGICVIKSGDRLHFVDPDGNAVIKCVQPVMDYGVWYFDKERVSYWYWDQLDQIIWNHKLEKTNISDIMRITNTMRITTIMQIKSTRMGSMSGGQSTTLLHVDEEENLYVK